PIGEYESFSLSRDGTRVAVERVQPQTARSEIWTFDLSSGNESRLVSGQGGNVRDPVFSPDGSQAAYQAFVADGVVVDGARDELAVTRADGAGSETRLPMPRKIGNVPLADWSADGRFLLIERQEESTGINDLWVMPVVGSHQAFPFLQTSFNKVDARFSPNGLW